MPIYNRYGAGGGWGMGEERAAYTGNVPKAPKPRGSFAAPTKKAPMPRPAIISFDKGDRVHHTTFGSGTVLSVKQMGGDVMYEIEFDKVGTKKLMASFARLTPEE